MTNNQQPSTNNFQIISKIQKDNKKPFDLEERLFLLSQESLEYCSKIKKTLENQILIKQFLRSVTSIGANYIEACESLSKKDYLYRLKISRKEAKEALYWIKLLRPNSFDASKSIDLQKEIMEVKNIISAIILNSEKGQSKRFRS